MAKLTLNDIVSLANTNTAKAALNDNFTAIEEAIEHTLSRDGTLPNQMEADIDLNSNDLLNVGTIDASEFLLNGVPLEQTVAYANKSFQLFSGTGVQTNFTLNTDPASLGNLEVSIKYPGESGLELLRPGLDFNFTGTTLSFVTPPPAGTDNILVRYDQALPTGVTAADAILYTPPSTGVTTTVKGFLDSLWNAGVNAGAALIRFLQPGTGAVARTVEDKLNEVVSVKDFGAIGDGTSHPLSERFATLAEAQVKYPHATSLSDEIDWAAIQAAINFATSFVWQGTTRATELASTGGAVYVPMGTYLVNRKIRFAPSLRLFGDGTSNDWTARTTATGGPRKLGSCIKSTYSNFDDYVFDTSPYNAAGVRLDNTTLIASDSFNGVKTEVHNVHIENMSFIGNWATKGFNMAGAVKSGFKNCYINGFTVGVRWTATWYGYMEDTRVHANYRGIIMWFAVTDMQFRSLSTGKWFDAPVYNPAVNGRESTDPPVGGALTQVMIDKPQGIYNFYGNATGQNVTVESWDVAFMSFNGVDDYRDIYVEAIQDVVCRVKGPDQQHSKFHFDTIVSNAVNCDLLWTEQARTELTCNNHNYTPAQFRKLIQYLDFVGDRQFCPVFRGLFKTVNDTYDDAFIRYLQDDYLTGSWNPQLLFGGVSAGAQVGNVGKWVRNGRLVTCFFTVQVPTLSGAVGGAQISGLPFNSDATALLYGAGSFGFTFAYTGTNQMNVPNSSAFINIFNTNNTHFVNGADIRGVIQYYASP